MKSAHNVYVILFMAFYSIVRINIAYAISTTEDNDTMATLTELQLQQKLKLHKEWRSSKGTVGEILDLSGVNLKGVVLSKIDLVGANFSKANLIEADFTGSDLTGSNFAGANLTAAHLVGTELIGADFSDANLSGADVSGAFLANARLIKAILIGTNLTGAYMSLVNLTEATLMESNLQNANLSMANLTMAHLYRANLSKVDLFGAELCDANLARVDLTDANLNMANLSGADLSMTNLARANLESATLNSATLIKTNIDNAKLSNTSMVDTWYESIVGTPANNFIGGISGIETIRYMTRDGYPGLSVLKKIFKDRGLREVERRATFAIEHGKNAFLHPIEKFFRMILFEFTCAYGFHYGKPLIILWQVTLVFSLIYNPFNKQAWRRWYI